MLMIVKNGIDTPEGKRGVQLSRELAADLVLIQDGVYFACNGWLDDYNGNVYVLEEDLGLRGLINVGIGTDIRKIDYDTFVDLMITSDKVVGVL